MKEYAFQSDFSRKYEKSDSEERRKALKYRGFRREEKEVETGSSFEVEPAGVQVFRSPTHGEITKGI